MAVCPKRDSRDVPAWGGRLARGLLFGTAVLLALAVMTAPVSADPTLSPDAESTFVQLINGLRTSQGSGELVVDPRLTDLARRWAATMAAAGAISHNPNLTVDLPEPWTKGGENVGVGSDVPTLHDAFVASPEHYRNLIDPLFTRIGIGVVIGTDGRLYVAEEFLQPTPPRHRASRSRRVRHRHRRPAALTAGSGPIDSRMRSASLSS